MPFGSSSTGDRSQHHLLTLDRSYVGEIVAGQAGGGFFDGVEASRALAEAVDQVRPGSRGAASGGLGRWSIRDRFSSSAS